MSYRAVIVDDEPLSRRRIRKLLEDESDIVIEAECANADEALHAFREHKPDLAFVDVQMPGKSGIELVRECPDELLPLIVFVTAFDHYALEAFEVHALDYIVKPVNRERFAAALAHARKSLQRNDWKPKLEALRTPVDAARIERIVVRTKDRILWIPTRDIDWIESAGNYARLHVGKQTHLIREKMDTIESRLDNRRFVRVHRRAIVNLDRVREIVPVSRTEYEIVLSDGAHVPLSRGYRSRMEFLLGDF